ncbi:MAG: hypothetical protein KKD07_06060 [Candidatus Omnitrophica bacterium]|nr:hypothetical protein [Candidatus Omnitrophota bacterium]MBU1995588.1 hypothetical protein [Candidatus Omnitrophota bacterium]MBU4333987.1 hypothetical protein [Candidatus Omnitrophota bacterium]
MNENKRNVPLIVALSIPVLMIVLTVISIYVPTLFIKPKIDFIYSTGANYCYKNRYTVEKGKIIENGIKINEKDNCQEPPDSRLYYYDVEKQISLELPYEKAQKYTLDTNNKSSDGFEIVSGSSSDMFFYDGSSYYKKFLKKSAFSRRLNMKVENYYDYKFLGWVKE